LRQWLADGSKGYSQGRPVEEVDEGQPFHLNMLSALLAEMNDPDHAILQQFRVGVTLGVLRELPRTPALYEEQIKWRLPFEPFGANEMFAANYGSIEEHLEEVRRQFKEDEGQGLMYEIGLDQFLERFGDKCAVSALAVLVEKGKGKPCLVNGKTVMVQWDEQLPRPYSRINLIQGTKGVWGGYPDRVVVEGITDTEDWTEGDGLKKFYDQYEHPLFKRMGEESKRNGGHGGMDFLMWWRTIYCLRNGEPLDQDVYDGASWSVVGPLSEKSVKNRGRSVDFPDFTRGNWKTTPPLGIVS
jgi:hypothetical protein